MSRTCIICGRPLKTGRKYCYEHRNSNLGSRFPLRRGEKRVIILIVFFVIGAWLCNTELWGLGILFLITAFLLFWNSYLKQKKLNKEIEKKEKIKEYKPQNKILSRIMGLILFIFISFFLIRGFGFKIGIPLILFMLIIVIITVIVIQKSEKHKTQKC